MSTDQSNSIDHLAVEISNKDHIRGNVDAQITLVEYGDYECPDCFNAEPVVAEIRKRAGEKLRLVFRHYPQSSIHPRASAAARAAEAAAMQGKFWEMHDALFRLQKELGNLDLTHLALQLGLEIYHFQQDSESDISARRVRMDHDGAVRSGVKGTPTFFINGRRYRGDAAVEPLLRAMNL